MGTCTTAITTVLQVNGAGSVPAFVTYSGSNIQVAPISVVGTYNL